MDCGQNASRVWKLKSYAHRGSEPGSLFLPGEACSQG